MADPFRLRVLKAMTETIKTVTPANGYTHDLSDYADDGGTQRPRVFRGRDKFGLSDPLPLVSVLEHPRALDNLMGSEGTSVSTGDWELIVQGFVEDDPENPTDPAHILAAEVIKAIIGARKKFNNLGLGSRMPCVDDIEIGSYVVRPADDVISASAFFYMIVNLRLVEDLADPFAE